MKVNLTILELSTAMITAHSLHVFPFLRTNLLLPLQLLHLKALGHLKRTSLRENLQEKCRAPRVGPFLCEPAQFYAKKNRKSAGNQSAYILI